MNVTVLLTGFSLANYNLILHVQFVGKIIVHAFKLLIILKGKVFWEEMIR